MRTRVLLPALLLVAAGAVAACDDDDFLEPFFVTWTATMNAANEVALPGVASPGTGLATFELDGSLLRFHISVASLTSPPVSSHVHLAPAGVNGPIVIDLFPPGTTVPTATTNNDFASGAIDLSLPNVTNRPGFEFSGDSLRRLLDMRQLYVDVHTERYPGGEIRGQLVRQP